MTDTNERVRELQREYLRAWRKKNPDKVKQYSRTYWERKAARVEQTEEIDAENKI